LILPGVGAFDKAMSELRKRGLVDALREAALVRRVPVLGVCLGMQLLGRGSQEGSSAGLGWIAADTRKIEPPAGSKLKVPHIGWSTVKSTGRSALFRDSGEMEKFYFVHSYYMHCDDSADVAAVIDYGGELCCALSRGNIHGVQFHPEKSHRHGMRLLRDFAKLVERDGPHER